MFIIQENLFIQAYLMNENLFKLLTIQSECLQYLTLPIQQLIMNEILTLQQISDIDTFTLQQKIQELEHHPYAKYYEQLIAIAKLELVQRYKVQQFGRMLINDQIPVFPDIHIKSQLQLSTHVNGNKKIAKSQRKIDFAECLKRSLVPEEDHVVIGRPVLGNYRYVPKPPSNVVKQKKSVTQSRKSTNTNMKRSYDKKPKILPKIPTASSLKSQKNLIKDTPEIPHSLTQKTSASEHIQSLKHKQTLQTNKDWQLNEKQQQFAFNLQDKKKIQLIKSQSKLKEGIKIKYIENDVYDGEKLVLDKPLKLAEIKVQPMDSEESILDISDVKDQTEDNVSRYNTSIAFDQIKQEIIVENPMKHNQNINLQQKVQNNRTDDETNKNSVSLETKKKEQSNKVTHISQTLPIMDIKNSINNKLGQTIQVLFDNESPIKQQTAFDMKLQRQQKKYETLQVLPQVKKQQANKSKIGENKGRSLSLAVNLPKTSRDTKNYNAGQNFSEVQQFTVNTLSIAQQLKVEQQKLQNKPVQVFQKQKKVSQFEPNKTALLPQPQKPLPSIFPYHQHIPSFSKLFPHSSSLINDLRSIQKQLQDHLDKKINTISRNDQYLRIRENQLMFKVVSQSEKARKYKNMFAIQLQNYFVKSQIMIDRLKKNNVQTKQSDLLLYRVVRQKQDVYDIISNAFHRTQNWYELPHGMDLKMSWNLLWTWSKPQIDIKQLFYFQKVNHFFGNKEIARKDLLKKNIQRIKKLGAKAKQSFDIIPETYYLPGQNMQFVRKFRQCSMKPGLNYWIMKPVGLSRGRGIQLITKIQDVVFSQPVVVQKYLENPLLLQGYKFDMRIYVLVTSINPLEAYVYRQGFARISTQKYSLQTEDVSNKFIHLTNFSVQKQNIDEPNPSKPKQIRALTPLQKQLGGCKITLNCLKQKLKNQNIQWSHIEQQIDSIVLKSLISTMNVIQQNPNCFELFGYDIIIDDNKKCWLIQVNSSPSLEKDFTVDQIVKQQLVDDVISIVDPVPYDRERLLEVVSRRRKELEGLKSHINTQNNSCSQLNLDLHYILHGRKLRKYGQKVQNTNFRRIAPGQGYQSIIKTVQQYKLTSITRQQP